MLIEKRTKNIWFIDGKRIDARQLKKIFDLPYKGLRAAIMIHLAQTNPKLTKIQVDRVACKLITQNLRALSALRYDSVYV